MQNILVYVTYIFFILLCSAANSCPTSPRGGHGGLANIKKVVNAENLVQAAYAAMEDKGEIANTGKQQCLVANAFLLRISQLLGSSTALPG